jgi:hypothetical protein
MFAIGVIYRDIKPNNIVAPFAGVALSPDVASFEDVSVAPFEDDCF